MGRTLNVRLPQKLKKHVEKKASEEYRSQNSVVQEAVDRFFSGDKDE